MIDLHTHSHCSDGSLSPARLVREAEAAGVEAIALCDHNTVEGLPEFMEAAVGSSLEAVPGVEFSTDYRGIELHILALFVRPCHYEGIRKRLEQLRRDKQESNLRLLNALNREGYAITLEQVQGLAGSDYINRAHVARALTEKGYTASVNEAFARLLAPGRGYYTPPRLPDAFETIAYIKSLGAVAVLAHPFLNLREPQLRTFLPPAKKAGLDAVETQYSLFDGKTAQRAAAIAKEYGLLESGGSDFHGASKPDIAIGVGRGGLCVPKERLEDLRKRCRN